MRLILRAALPALAASVAASVAWAEPLYKDGSWGVVPQDAGRTCVVVLNSEDRKHAFHFVVDGAQNAATVGILDDYLPDPAYITASTTITVDLGPEFARKMEFKRRFDGSANYLAADLPQEDLDSILDALQSGKRGVSLSFENGVIWRIPPPKSEEAASAIAQCWNEALRGAHA